MKRIDLETWEEMTEEERAEYQQALMREGEDQRWNEIEKEGE